MTTINQFVSKFSNLARSNLFQVLIDSAPGAETSSVGRQNVSFLAKNAQLPGRTLGSVPIKYLNNTINYPGDVAIQELSLTVMNDESYATRKFFEDWMEAYKSLSETKSSQWDAWSSGKITVSPIDAITGGTEGPEYSFIHCFPTDLGSIDLSWDSSDTIQEYSVTFTYSYWVKK